MVVEQKIAFSCPDCQKTGGFGPNQKREWIPFLSSNERIGLQKASSMTKKSYLKDESI